MNLSRQLIEEFIELYQRHFGEELGIEEAEKRGLALMTIIKEIYKPILKDKQYEIIKKTL